MPLPEVKDSDTEKSYVAKCMTSRSKKKDLTDEDERKQSLAMCFAEFKRSRGIKESSRSMYQILKEAE